MFQDYFSISYDYVCSNVYDNINDLKVCRFASETKIWSSRKRNFIFYPNKKKSFIMQ